MENPVFSYASQVFGCVLAAVIFSSQCFISVQKQMQESKWAIYNEIINAGGEFAGACAFSLAYDKKFLLGAAFLTEMDGFIFCLQNVYQHV